MTKRIGLLTGGGDCPGLNPALRGCVMRGLDHGFEFTGFLEGWRGLVEGNTQPVALADVKEIVGKGGTLLGSSRTNPFKEEGAVEKCLASLKKFKIDALVACGGEDTLGVAAKFYKEHKVNVVGVPKTMDLGRTLYRDRFRRGLAAPPGAQSRRQRDVRPPQKSARPR